MRTVRTARTLPSILLAAVVGCGSGLYPVEGKIVYPDGKPATDLAGGTVSFESQELRVNAIGEIDAQGTFRLTTQKQNDGVRPGTYKVGLSPPDPEDRDDEKPGRKRKVPSIRLKGPREFTVKSERNEITLTVERVK
jgi:hypothetical protein